MLNAEDCAKALTRGGGIASSKAGYVTISRDIEAEEDASSYPGLDAHLFREYIYGDVGDMDEDEIFIKINLYRMSFRENVASNVVATSEEFFLR